jgi:hypothetical protein
MTPVSQWGVRIHYPDEFSRWLAGLAEAEAAGDALAALRRRLVASELAVLSALTEPPAADSETGELKWVRQRRRYLVWRVSHPYHEDAAVRLICWFPPDAKVVVVALFAGDKKAIGDTWYDSVGTRADAVIEQWKRSVGYDR